MPLLRWRNLRHVDLSKSEIAKNYARRNLLLSERTSPDKNRQQNQGSPENSSSDNSALAKIHVLSREYMNGDFRNDGYWNHTMTLWPNILLRDRKEFKERVKGGYIICRSGKAMWPPIPTRDLYRRCIDSHNLQKLYNSRDIVGHCFERACWKKDHVAVKLFAELRLCQHPK